VAELELDAREIKFATDTERNAAPGPDEILFKGITMPRLIKLPAHWYQAQPFFHL